MISRQIVGNLVAAIATASSIGLLAIVAFDPLPTFAQSGASTPSPEESPSTVSPPRTEFSCTQFESNWVTVARRGPNVTPPMIRWTTTLGDFTPEERCTIVSDRLNRAVAERGGTLGGLMMTYGPVRGSRVICYVNARNETCTQDNILFTLRPGDNPDQILRQIVNFSVYASGSYVQQSNRRSYALLGEAVEACLDSPESCL